MTATSQGPIDNLYQAVTAVPRILRTRSPTQGPIEQFVNTLLFVAHTQNVPSLRTVHALLGKYTRVFGGETATSFADVTGLMAREPEKIDWFSGPLQDRADYLTKSYVPFLLASPNHALRREHIIGRVARARAALSDLDALMDGEPNADRALARFMFRHFVDVELEPSEVTWFLEFRERAQPLVLLPKWLRTTVLRGLHEQLLQRREYFLERIEQAGQPIADSWFDVIWFNAGTLGFYPKKALEALEQQPELRPQLLDEVDLPPTERVKTRALIHEMLRIHGRIASANYVEQGKVRIALMATAVVDPARYHDPMKVDLTRDHRDTVAFSGPAPTRKCPGELFAPDTMATVVAHWLRAGITKAPD